MLINKCTEGHVVQTYDTIKGEFLEQVFCAGDDCQWVEHGTGEVVQPWNEYLPFDMVQPNQEYQSLVKQLSNMIIEQSESTEDILVNFKVFTEQLIKDIKRRC